MDASMLCKKEPTRNSIYNIGATATADVTEVLGSLFSRESLPEAI